MRRIIASCVDNDCKKAILEKEIGEEVEFQKCSDGSGWCRPIAKNVYTGESGSKPAEVHQKLTCRERGGADACKLPKKGRRVAQLEQESDPQAADDADNPDLEDDEDQSVHAESKKTRVPKRLKKSVSDRAGDKLNQVFDSNPKAIADFLATKEGKQYFQNVESLRLEELIATPQESRVVDLTKEVSGHDYLEHYLRRDRKMDEEA